MTVAGDVGSSGSEPMVRYGQNKKVQRRKLNMPKNKTFKKYVETEITEQKERYLLLTWERNDESIGASNIITTWKDDKIQKVFKNHYKNVTQLVISEISKKEAMNDYGYDFWYKDDTSQQININENEGDTKFHKYSKNSIEDLELLLKHHKEDLEKAKEENPEEVEEIKQDIKEIEDVIKSKGK